MEQGLQGSESRKTTFWRLNPDQQGPDWQPRAALREIITGCTDALKVCSPTQTALARLCSLFSKSTIPTIQHNNHKEKAKWRTVTGAGCVNLMPDLVQYPEPCLFSSLCSWEEWTPSSQRFTASSASSTYAVCLKGTPSEWSTSKQSTKSCRCVACPPGRLRWQMHTKPVLIMMHSEQLQGKLFSICFGV